MRRITQRSAILQACSMLSNASRCRQLAPKLKNVGQRVLLLVGEGDWLIPSQAEGKRLETVLARCIVKACTHLSAVSGCEEWNGIRCSCKAQTFVYELHGCSDLPGRSVSAGRFALPFRGSDASDQPHHPSLSACIADLRAIPSLWGFCGSTCESSVVCSAELPVPQPRFAAGGWHQSGEHHEGGGLLCEGAQDVGTCQQAGQEQLWRSCPHRAAHRPGAGHLCRQVRTHAFVLYSVLLPTRNLLGPSSSSCLHRVHHAATTQRARLLESLPGVWKQGLASIGSSH